MVTDSGGGWPSSIMTLPDRKMGRDMSGIVVGVVVVLVLDGVVVVGTRVGVVGVVGVVVEPPPVVGGVWVPPVVCADRLPMKKTRAIAGPVVCLNRLAAVMLDLPVADSIMAQKTRTACKHNLYNMGR
jgi:hypothetical protein